MGEEENRTMSKLFNELEVYDFILVRCFVMIESMPKVHWRIAQVTKAAEKGMLSIRYTDTEKMEVIGIQRKIKRYSDGPKT